MARSPGSSALPLKTIAMRGYHTIIPGKCGENLDQWVGNGQLADSLALPYTVIEFALAAVKG